MAMSEEHKAALARGRREARIIKPYLDALGSRKRGRPVTPSTLRKRIEGLEQRISAETNPLKAIELRQARIDAERRLATLDGADVLSDLEAGFIKYAASYSTRKGISYAAWREAGVPAAVLKRAGVTREA